MGGTAEPTEGMGGTAEPTQGMGGTAEPTEGMGGTAEPTEGMGGTAEPTEGMGGTAEATEGMGGTAEATEGMGGLELAAIPHRCPIVVVAWAAAAASMSHGCGADRNAGPSLSLPGDREQQPWAIVVVRRLLTAASEGWLRLDRAL